ncbi:unnamed protein product [Owenia fusiformis]|uniref:Uncharacterized protein n=1 Tax=Owenia fusiformis TaxID=6347 RepID=A0A8S4NPZ6_OWEFU|nr:unnamed protein product [Owenia fusiformis]
MILSRLKRFFTPWKILQFAVFMTFLITLWELYILNKGLNSKESIVTQNILKQLKTQNIITTKAPFVPTSAKLIQTTNIYDHFKQLHGMVDLRRNPTTLNMTIFNSSLLNKLVYEDPQVPMRLHSDNGSTIIPQIIHQTWMDENIPDPDLYSKWIRSWQSNHPTWSYWFWTDNSARDLIKNYYPQFLELYDKYPLSIHRADALRYFVLYTYGGVYVDLDMESLKPLDALTTQHACIIPREPMQQSYLVWKKTKLASNAFMACRPHHPFFKMVIQSLPESNIIGRGKIVEKTGPVMLQRIVDYYSRQPIEQENNYDKIHSPDSSYFLPTLDKDAIAKLDQMCKVRIKYVTDKTMLSLCNDMIKRNFSNIVTRKAYTNHNWVHTYVMPPDQTKHVNIREIIKNVKLGFLKINS